MWLRSNTNNVFQKKQNNLNGGVVHRKPDNQQGDADNVLLPPDEKEQALNNDARLDHGNEDEESDKDDNVDGQIVSFQPVYKAYHAVIVSGLGLCLWCLMPLSTIFSYIGAVSFISGGNWNTWR